MFIPGIVAFCRLVIGLTFLMSLGGKLRSIRSFYHTLTGFRLVPARLTGLVVFLLMGGEASIVICMLLGSNLLLPGFLLALALLLTFSGALAVVIARKQRLSCHCFGTNSEQMISPVDLWRNAGFIFCAVGGCGVQRSGEQPLSLMAWLLVTLMAAVFVLLWTQLSAIVQLFREVATVR